MTQLLKIWYSINVTTVITFQSHFTFGQYSPKNKKTHKKQMMNNKWN